MSNPTIIGIASVILAIILVFLAAPEEAIMFLKFLWSFVSGEWISDIT